MLWLLGAGVLALLGLGVRAGSADATPQAAPEDPHLARLRTRLRQLATELETDARRPRVLFAGQPGAGKSTLVDLLTDRLLEPRPRIGVETDATDWTSEEPSPLFYRHADATIVDSPGVGTRNHPAGVLIRELPLRLFDIVCVFISGKLHDADTQLLQLVGSARRVPAWESPAGVRHDARIVVVRSRAEELVDDGSRAAVAAELLAVCGRDVDRPHAYKADDFRLLFVSARTGEGVDELRRLLWSGSHEERP